jgi:hypothetical protein
MIAPPISNRVRTVAAAALFTTITVTQGAVTSVVIMSGLNEPRDVSMAPNGDLYVIEAGTPIDTTDLDPIPTDTGVAYFGNTGSVSLLSGGVVSRPITGLPMLYSSGPMGEEVIGGHGIAATDSGLIVSIGLGSTAANRNTGPTGAAGLGSVYRFFPGQQLDVTDITAGSSNPFHLAVSGSQAILADAGDNSVMLIDDGGISRVGFLPNLPNGAQFVPTGVAANPAGGIYVGGLSGLPFEPGSASIYLMDGGTTELFATGFTNIIDIAIDAAGTMFVLEFATNGLFSGDQTGGLWSLSSDGSSRELLMSTGLVHPTGLTTGLDGTLYVTHLGGPGGSGELLAITIPEPGTATLTMLAIAALGGCRRRTSATS